MKKTAKILMLAVLFGLMLAACGGKNTDILEEYGDTIMVEITMENGGVILVAISMLLTLIAGIIPARLAAKKDPVEALRSE